MMSLGKITHLMLMAALITCLVPGLAYSMDEPDNLHNAIGEVVYMVGTVKAEQPDGMVRNLDLKKQVIARDTIVTGINSSVEIVFKDDSVFSQGPKARISMDEFVYTGDSSASKLLFKMGEGTFRYVTGQIVKQNPDGFALETPTTTIGIRGTEVFATISRELERIGNLELTPGLSMTVGQQTITKSMTAVSADPATGRISAPEPVSAEEAAEVIKAAPQTTQGELGTKNDNVDDMTRKVDSFRDHIERTKERVGNGRPDYADLHSITLHHRAHKAAERDNGDATEAQAQTEGGGDGGGGHP